MFVRKAVITAAGRGVRLFPASDTVEKSSLPLLDRDGVVKPLLQIIAEEALDAGIEELAIICAPGDEARYRERFALRCNNLRAAFGAVDWAEQQAERLEELLLRTRFLPQTDARGYGHAVLQARAFAGSDPFLLMLGDHLYFSADGEHRCAAQLIAAAAATQQSTSAVQATREHLVPRYGTIRAVRDTERPGLWRVKRVLEKPSISRAELELSSNGLRAAHYLCFFGMHVLHPQIFEPLARAAAAGGEVGLSEALQELATADQLCAQEIDGTRCDIGGNTGYLRSQLALALAGSSRDEVLSAIVEILATKPTSARGDEA